MDNFFKFVGKMTIMAIIYFIGFFIFKQLNGSFVFAYIYGGLSMLFYCWMEGMLK